MSNSLLKKISDILNLFKIEDQMEMFVGIFAAAIIANGSIHLPNIGNFVLAIIFGFMNISAAIVLNQYTDAGADRVNKPYRAIPSGRIKPSSMLRFSIILYLIGIAIALYLGTEYVILSVISIIVGVTYSFRIFGVRDNIVGSMLLLAFGYVIWAFLVGWVLYEPISVIPWWFIGILLVVDSAEALVKDYRDVIGDAKEGMTTLPIKMGYTVAAKINFIVYSLPLFVLIFAFLLGILNFRFALIGIYCLLTSIIAFYGLIKRQRREDALMAYRVVTSNYFITRIIGAWAFLP